MQPSEPGFGDRVFSLLQRTRGLVAPGQIILDLPNVELGGVRPAFGGLGSHADFTTGLHYAPAFLEAPSRLAEAQVLASLNRYYGAEALYGSENGPSIRYAYARYHHRPEEVFYGVGPGSRKDDASIYRFNEAVVGTLLGRSLSGNVLVGSHFTYRADRYGRATSTAELPVERRFDPSTIAGLGADVDYLMLGSFVEYDSRSIPYDRAYGRRFAPTENRLRSISLDARRGMYLSAEMTHHLDVRNDRFSFTRFTVDAQQYVPILHGMHHGLALRQFVSFTHTTDDQTVPFYRLQTIGGSKSLRGYSSDRFRDRNVALVNAEVRCQVWHWLDMAWFVDAGQVFHEMDDVRLGDIRYDVGMGFRVRTSQGTIGRIEFARSPEGFTTHLKLGSLL